MDARGSWAGSGIHRRPKRAGRADRLRGKRGTRVAARGGGFRRQRENEAIARVFKLAEKQQH